MKRLLLILTFVMTAPTAWAQCVGVNGINTIMNCPAAQNPQGTDYVLSYQTMQSPNNTRKMTLNQLSAFFGGGAFLPLTGGTLTGPLVLPNNPTQALQAATKQYVDAAVSNSTLQVQCGGTDDTAAINAAQVAIQNGPQHSVWIHGACNFPGPVNPQVFTVPVGFYGDGPGVTTFTFAGVTDGFNWMLDNPSGTWGQVSANGFSIIRQPTSPSRANTALTLYANPAKTANGYPLPSSLMNITITSPNPSVSEWNTGIYLSGLTGVPMANVQILGIAGGGTDLGDVGLVVDGPSSSHYGVGYFFGGGSIVQGYSTGILASRYVQDVTVTGGSYIIGQYNGMVANGVSSPVSIPTTATAAMGATTLQFAAGAVGAYVPGDVLNGTNLHGGTRILSVNNGTGVVGISPATTGAITLGESIAFQTYYAQEQIVVSDSSFNASHRDLLLYWGGFHQINNTAFLRYGTSTTDWAAIDMEDSNNFTITAPTITGVFPATGSEHAIIVNATGTNAGSAPNTIRGMVASSLSGAAIVLSGTIQETLVDGFNCVGCFGGGVDNSANPTGNVIGIYNVNTSPNMTFSSLNEADFGTATGGGENLVVDAALGSAKQLIFGRPTLSGSPTLVWNMGSTGGNDDFKLGRYVTPGALTDIPFSIIRSTGNATFLHNVDAASVSISGAAGVSCSGSPSGSFAVTNGIVTHC